MVKSFAPQVIIDGKTVTPEGWMWVFGFALAGVPWAIETALSPIMDTKVRRYELRRRLYFRQEHLEALEVRVKKTRNEIEQIARDLKML